MYDSMKSKRDKQEIDQELDMLFSQSDNKQQVTMTLATQTEGMMDNDIL